MKIPYIKIKQREEVFFLIKFNASEMADKIDFHFRDPYSEFEKQLMMDKYNDYIKRIQRKGIDLKQSEEGIQRRLQISRINSIKEYIESSVEHFLPNSILLSANVSKFENFEDDYLVYENNDVGIFDLPDDIKFTIIDGQHRLAGLFTSKEKGNFEIPAVLLFNVSISTAARLFADINGKQKPVNRSLIYDLFEDMTEEKYNEISMYHSICRKFYSDRKSPLYMQIKMLGIGRGAISQAFFIDYTKNAIKNTNLTDTQEIYNQLFFYFKSFQRVFPEDWPVPEDFKSNSELEEYAERILKKRKSQLVKTNGFGAILRLFPKVYMESGGEFSGYIKLINRLKDKISWLQDPNKPQGTGKAFQNYLLKTMSEILFDK